MRGTKSKRTAMTRRESYFAYILLGISILVLGYTSQALAVDPKESSLKSSFVAPRPNPTIAESLFNESTEDNLASVVHKSITAIAEEMRPVDCAVDACVALTFDDGPDSMHTPALLNVLKKHKAHASFFLIGNKIAGREDLVRRIAAEGHDVGNHSWAHPNMTKLTPAQIDSEFNQTQTAIASTGVAAPHLFRPPYGKQSPLLTSRIPVPRILWNVDPHDWAARPPELIAGDLLANVRPGAIVVMHDTADIAADALAIETLSKTYKLVTVTKLLNLQPGDRGQYFSR